MLNFLKNLLSYWFIAGQNNYEYTPERARAAIRRGKLKERRELHVKTAIGSHSWARFVGRESDGTSFDGWVITETHADSLAYLEELAEAYGFKVLTVTFELHSGVLDERKWFIP
ncbi:hypothetical protein [Deinococcus pimensis]|uniref:hypothetical protein n=1 Tax=Deinococcus pimensis TaxID=309888 RepID=UPI0004822F63|nr:hypothetical protein [Deinococcus pimensis]